MVVTDISERKRAEEELRRAHDELDIRVHQRTKELKEANVSLQNEIAERKRAEEGLKRAVDDLARSNKELEQFAYVASHDLQEPLRTVASYVDLLSMKYKGKLDEKADKYIFYAVDGASRMSTLINDLLTYSRVGTRGKPFEQVDMNVVFKSAVDNLKSSIRGQRAEISHDELPGVFGDETQLVQLLQNMIGNAIKFRKKDTIPRIHISAARGSDAWTFGVRDNGIGIEPEFCERIFTIFQRLHTRDEYPGTGVGLAICRRIVERHGGRIWLESRLGEGSTFFFTMPIKEKIVRGV
jgi:light-regulated signal transduction histidine kinase (bacteriophytochrome)